MSDHQKPTIKVFLVGDSHIMRSGLRRILETQAAIRVLGEVSVKRASPNSISRHRPDLVLIDLDPRGADPLGFIGTLHKTSEKPAILVLSELADYELARKALTLGASGIVLKMQPSAVLIAAIRELCPSHRDTSLPGSETIADTHRVTNRNFEALSDNSNYIIKIDSLTVREREIIRLVALGLKNKDIANRLSISDITVRHHLTSIFCKLEIADRQNLLILAHRYGLADLSLSTESA
jgi:DNA-binding NarL/FixJ family response regulator